ncbi:MAG TPA: metallophosphoesterase family protein [Gaiellaceae bacterium]
MGHRLRPAHEERGLCRRRARISRRAVPARPVLIALVADTHLPPGSRRLPEACSELLRQADLILHLGDVRTLEALAELEALGPPVHAVRGNVDDEELRALLPERLTIEAEGLRLGLVHDAGAREARHERLLGWFPGCDLIAYGHTHVPELERVGETWIVNPGSPTERRRAAARTMALVRNGLPSLVTLP